MSDTFKRGLVVGCLVLIGLVGLIFITDRENDHYLKFNPLVKLEIGYAKLPKTVTYNHGKAFNKQATTPQFPDPYEEVEVVNQFGKVEKLTFKGGQSPDDMNYAKVSHKGDFVQEIEFVSWDDIPSTYQLYMTR
ncbi:hypothetical protein OL233_04475 [Vagococcus sp. PNs007]|uniref:YxeA family protein n=1 Tax=Vagococcus proximus TaxID=2991417 RepID=A0ABT5X0K6_9ENTE|nr:hypothetical protein [Vagococcus proximus]MDF0479538.1 hypothetical protein [Vagococcus proximus]